MNLGQARACRLPRLRMMWLPFWRLTTNPTLEAPLRVPDRKGPSEALLAGASLELEIFPSCFSGNRVTRGDTVLDVEIRRFAYVPYDPIMSVALGCTTGQSRCGRDASAFCFPLKDDRIAPRVLALIFMISANSPDRLTDWQLVGLRAESHFRACLLTTAPLGDDGHWPSQ
jgi:hypothetical protein